MEKITVETTITKLTTHHFYCDDCGKHIGESKEYEDGWYSEYGEFELKIYLPRGWYTLNKCLCDECRNKFLNKIYETLEAVGFELD